jgi:hypothetical protein
MKKLSWDFTKKPLKNENIAALRVRFVNALDPDISNEMYIRIPEGGRCDYFPLERMFNLYDSDGEIIKNIQAPVETAIEISYVGKQYLEILKSTSLELRQETLH